MEPLSIITLKVVKKGHIFNGGRKPYGDAKISDRRGELACLGLMVGRARYVYTNLNEAQTTLGEFKYRFWPKNDRRSAAAPSAK